MECKDTDSEPSTTDSLTATALPPARRVQLQWTDLNYFVQTSNSNLLEEFIFPVVKKNKKSEYWEDVGLPKPKIEKRKEGDFKQILSSCSGWVCPGEIVGIMGPSGSGKTSLLSVLAQR